MKLICDKCSEELESGIVNVLKHQFEDCKAHVEEKVEGGNFTIKCMPIINPIIKHEATNNQDR